MGWMWDRQALKESVRYRLFDTGCILAMLYHKIFEIWEE